MFSKNDIELLKKLADRAIARHNEDVVILIDPIHFQPYSINSQIGLKYGDVLDLVDAGLIVSENISIQLQLEPHESTMEFNYCGDSNLLIKIPRQQIGILPLSTVGRELIRLVDSTFDEEYKSYLCIHFGAMIDEVLVEQAAGSEI